MNQRLAAAALAMGMFSGCASIVSGVNQSISLETRVDGSSVAGAACTLSSNKGTWFVTSPGSVVVHRGFQDMVVECTRDGLAPSSTRVASHVRPLVFGNILFGGVIGIAVDSGDGAAFDYPDLFTINMVANAIGAAPVPPANATPATPATSPYAAPVSRAPNAPSGPAPAATIDAKDHRYQSAAEDFAVDRACSAKPVTAAMTERGPGFETYRITCTSGVALVARCDFGKCRQLD